MDPRIRASGYSDSEPRILRTVLRETNRPSCVLQSSDFSTTRPGNWQMADSLLTICQVLPGTKSGESWSAGHIQSSAGLQLQEISMN